MVRPSPHLARVVVLCWACTGSAAQVTNGKPAAEPPQSTARPAKLRPATDWTSYRGNPELQGVAAGSLAGKYELAWTFKTKGAVVSSPVVSTDTVFFGSSDQFVYAVDLSTGKKKWAFKTEDMVDAPPLVLDGRVFVGSYDFFVYALDAKTGKLLWKFETGDKIVGAANYKRMKDGSTRIIVGSYDSNLHCFDAETGKKLWSYETGNFINGTPAVEGDHAVFGGCDCVLHVVSITTGKKVMAVEVGQDCHIAGSVALAGNHVYFGHYGNAFVAIDLGDVKKPAWVYPDDRFAFFSSPSILPDRVLFGGRDRRLHCVDRATGKAIWTFKTGRKVDGSPVVCGDKVVFGSGDGRLYLLDLASGKQLWKYEIGGAVFSSPAVTLGMILVGSNDESLYAFKPVVAKATKSR